MLFRIINKLSLLPLPNFLSLSIPLYLHHFFVALSLHPLALFLSPSSFTFLSLQSARSPSRSRPPFQPLNVALPHVSCSRAGPPFPLGSFPLVPFCVASQMTMRKLRGSKSRAAHRTELFYAFFLSLSQTVASRSGCGEEHGKRERERDLTCHARNVPRGQTHRPKGQRRRRAAVIDACILGLSTINIYAFSRDAPPQKRSAMNGSASVLLTIIGYRTPKHYFFAFRNI